MHIKNKLTRKKNSQLLSLTDTKQINTLFKEAYEVKKQYIGTKVHLRGIIEFSNICIKNCLYCGIRQENSDIERFQMSEEEIIQTALWAYKNSYGSIVLQSGERRDEKFIGFIENILEKINHATEEQLGITLSLGEQTKETYQRWLDAGAHRYLLRIETSNPEIYKRIHPEEHSLKKRIKCLEHLQDIGYQVGTGVMIGIPGQSMEDLANDILFFKNNDIDMIGMGPFIPHHNTPMGHYSQNYNPQYQFMLGLKMIAVTRIELKNVNIAAATALQALKGNGREMGLKAGANIIMPNISDTKYRKHYTLYDNKPCLDENSNQCKNCLTNRVIKIGERIAFNEQGNAPHFTLRKSKTT